MSSKGIVYLVGAGPGDPGLITVKGRECLQKADMVVYDRLVNAQLLAMAAGEAELIYVGKSAQHHILSQEEINALLVRKAQEGKIVARLKGGDPFVFGRGGEEAEALAEAGIPFEVVPGVTSAIAAPAYAGIPVTHRDYASAFTVIAGHEDLTTRASDIDWSKIATGVGTLVFLMGVGNLPSIVGRLLKHGCSPDTPVAVIHWGTMAGQQVVVGSLRDIMDRAQKAGIRPPVVIVVGEVVKLRERLRWFDIKPLFGKRVLVTRSREQADTLSAKLRELGAEPVEFPTIRIAPPQDFKPLDAAIEHLSSYAWVIFTSANGVRSFMRLLLRARDARALAGVKLAAIGPATAGQLESHGLRADFVPRRYVAEAIAEGIGAIAGMRILLPRSDQARSALSQELEKQGASVDEVVAYRTLPAEPTESLREVLLSRKIDIVTFTSSSTVRNLVATLGREAGDGWSSLLQGVTVACIGPITAQTAQELGIEVDIVAQKHTIAGLVEAITEG